MSNDDTDMLFFTEFDPNFDLMAITKFGNNGAAV